MSDTAQPDVIFMQRALELAARASGQTHPNPMVGAVIVEGGVIVAEGWHHEAGKPHAEVEALKALGRAPLNGATIYVTLEPCSTCGRTGACTDAIIKSGIQRVVIGAVDPNPAHAGRGIDLLMAAGIEVVSGVLADDCADLNLIFNHWITAGTPFIAAKMALTLDGKFAAASGHSKWVTGAAARADVMRWRRYFPAIGVGANTVLSDNPSLTSRVGEEEWSPVRFVFDRSLKTVRWNKPLNVYADAHKARTIVICSPSASETLRKRIAAQGITLWELPDADDGHLDWSIFRKRCAKHGLTGIYIECGPTLATALIDQHTVDYIFSYHAPKFMVDSSSVGLGLPRETQSMQEAVELKQVRYAILGEDILSRGFL
jgi:diaminohydroxyphosphoribosylaminopyrimidine deaminase/5-amino-6-(5-phosphoribosylamino)uracil reductase